MTNPSFLDSIIETTKINFCKRCFAANTRILTMSDISKSMYLYPLEYIWAFNYPITPSGNQKYDQSSFSDRNIEITKIDFYKWCFAANTRSLTIPNISKSIYSYPLEWIWDFNRPITSGSRGMTNSSFSDCNIEITRINFCK